jgi:hypothetical protein
MKYRFYTIAATSILVLYLLRPVLPYIEYALNKEYIAKHICVSRNIPGNTCQGKCHLHKQLQAAAENNSPVPENNKNKVQNTRVDDHLLAGHPIIQSTETRTEISHDPRVPSLHDSAVPVFVPPEHS